MRFAQSFSLGLVLQAASVLGGPLVTVKNGTYEGNALAALNQEQYLGIPYARPPTGDLRFRPAQHLNTKWKNSRKAKTLPNACPQTPLADGITTQGVRMDEDCLALNIVKPAGNHTGLPVVVWIHGGSYQNVSLTSPQCLPQRLTCTSTLIGLLSVRQVQHVLCGQGVSEYGEPNYWSIYQLSIVVLWVPCLERGCCKSSILVSGLFQLR
jgi:hypothetical protein